MDYKSLHSWQVNASEAISIQKQLREQVVLKPLQTKVRYVSGADISYNRYATLAYGAFVTLDLETGQVIEEVTGAAEMPFPYVPGLLSFREIPVLLAAWEKLEQPPDVVFVDGQGITHPRRLGIATHLGLLIDRPTVGCGKSSLFGQFEAPAAEADSLAYITNRGEVLGAALRTKMRSKPILVSPGHLIDLDSALALVKATLKGYRLPEPTRLAHELANCARREATSASA